MPLAPYYHTVCHPCRAVCYATVEDWPRLGWIWTNAHRGHDPEHPRLHPEPATDAAIVAYAANGYDVVKGVAS